MNKQTKKKWCAAIVAIIILIFIIALPICIYATRETTNTTESEVAEQNSVIEEQATPTDLTTTEAITTEEITTTEEVTTEEIKIEVVTTEVVVTEAPTTEYVAPVEEILEEEEEVIDEDVVIEENGGNPYTALIDGLSEDEKYMIYQITFLESGNQSMEGQRAVIEVILNRVLSDKFPNSVQGVLSQSGQFSTWSYMNSRSHNSTQEEALQLVYTESPVLGSTSYVYFSTGKFSWAHNYVQIGAHWFGTY